MKSTVPQAEVTRFLDAWFAVRQFIQASNFNRFQRAGLSATQFMTLNLIPTDGDGISMGDLASRMNLKPATVAQTVDSLEARGMLTRTRGESDKRVVFVRMTAAGLKLQNAASSQFREQIRELLEAMGEEVRAGLIRGMESFSQLALPDQAPSDAQASRGKRGAPQE